jgi:uncharacterized membrane protein YeiB
VSEERPPDQSPPVGLAGNRTSGTLPDGGPAEARAAVASRRTPPGRVVGLDVARALAVFGMFGAHIGVVADDVDASPSTWLAVVNGRASILFAVLAGISLALLSGRSAPLSGDDLLRARVRIVVRAAWVYVIGAALESLDTGIHVILRQYAVLFLLALPFLRWPPRRLVVAATVLALLTPAANLWLTQAAAAGGVYDNVVVSLLSTGSYPALIWWTFILVGLAVGRCDLRATRIRANLLLIGAGLAVLGYGAGWVSTQWWADGRPMRVTPSWGPQDRWDLVYLSGAHPHSGTTFEIVGSVGVALAVIAVCLVVADRLPAVTFPLAAVGGMALTVYAAQIVAVWVEGTLEHSDNRPWLAYIVAAVVCTTLWRLLLGRGPLERLLTWTSVLAAGQVRRPGASARTPSPPADPALGARSPVVEEEQDGQRS